MNIILLSGGSGTRLWPLSNSARSKQFLRLLKAPSGCMESMLQRMVRQIGEARLSQSITIATNENQKDSIISQLGNHVNVVLEPERRDTFPAIALSTMYLLLEKHCPPQDVVAVMPCDPYTGAGYFETVARMADVVEQGRANMALMGICPTEPSSKYGYIVPDRGSAAADGARKVLRFTEKPTAEKARALLSEGALWNGGVFAFRLGYLQKIVEKYISVSSFAELTARYAELPQISFDYEIVEKASSVAVVPYSGEWKDLGTWDVLCGELSSPSLGLVKMAHNENTHVINELELPIVCMGTHNLVVAATPDGILVADKQSIGNLKDAVAGLSNRPMYEERRWGTYQVLHHEVLPDGCRVEEKYLRINAGKSISYQTHPSRSETWSVVDGEGLLALDGEVSKVGRGDVVRVEAGRKHSIYAITNLSVLELQSGKDLTDDETRRYEWNWMPYLSGQKDN